MRGRDFVQGQFARNDQHQIACRGFEGSVHPHSGKLLLAEAAEIWSSGSSYTTSPQLGHSQFSCCRSKSEVAVEFSRKFVCRCVVRAYSLLLIKRALINNDYENFCRIDAYLKSFWQCSAVVDGCVVVDNQIAIPNCLQKPIFARLHRSQAGQLAMVDAAQYIWWPRIYREIMLKLSSVY